MSYDHSRAETQSREMHEYDDLKDYERAQWLGQILNLVGEGKIKLTQWETDFIATWFKDYQGEPSVHVVHFTLKQREVIAQMWQQYLFPRREARP